MFKKESGEIKREGGEMDGSKRKKGRDLLFLAFSQVYLRPSKGIVSVKASLIQTCPEAEMQNTQVRKEGPRHQLATEKQMILCVGTEHERYLEKKHVKSLKQIKRT